MENIVVVGGGSAGWLTALYLKRVFPEKNITVIESSEIGILGAGEGATPHFVDLLNFLQISISDLIKDCDATIKNGIKFTNWNGDNKYFYHSFWPNNNLSFDGVQVDHQALSISSAFLSAINENENLSEIDFMQKISEQNKVPFHLNNYNYDIYGHYSLHFNASKLAIKLKQIASSRGVWTIDSKVKDFTIDKKNNITEIILENNNIVKSDFVFDCSGFHRLIIGNRFNSKWKSHSKYLPVDSALPFFIKMDGEIPPYTEAIAMDYGWIWKIPLQTRYGCGYVYDSSLIDEKEAIEELEKFLGFEPEYPRKDKGSFKFKAGYYEEPWIGNCIAIGLSAGFIEPLEATSIWVSIMSLERVLSNAEFLHESNKKIKDDFNKYFRDINDQVVDFIFFHYMSERNSSEFWKKFKVSNMPKGLKSIVDIWEYRLPKYSDTVGKIWATYNWISVAAGINRLNKKLIHDSNKYSNAQKYGASHYKNLKELQDQTADKCLNHKNFIEKMKNV